jgi:hypothetical protein
MSSPFAAPAAINSPGAILDPNTKGAPDERNIGPLVAMTPGPLGLLALAKAAPFRRYLPQNIFEPTIKYDRVLRTEIQFD